MKPTTQLDRPTQAPPPSARSSRRGDGAPPRATAVLVGVLFLTATAAFSVGSSLVAAHFSGDSPGTTTLLAGVALEVYTGLAVAGIGLAMLPLLARHSLGLARAYLALRVLECLAIVAAGAYMLATRRQLDHYDLVVYSFTAVGGIVFSYLLYMTGLVPRLLSMLGLVGYVALLLGIPAALVGLVDLDTGWGMIFLAPGGLFELILPLLLLVRGFSAGGATTSRPSGTSLGQAATVAGLGLLAMSVLAFSSFSAFERLVVEGDAAATARNLVDHQLLLRGITYGFTVVAVLDVVVAWALYALLRPVSRRLALLSTWLRVAYAAGFAAALSNLYVAAGEPGAQALTSLSQFKDGWDLALAVFGLHLLVLGYLVFRSKYMPRVLGVLVMVASLGYLIDSLGGLLSERYHANVAAFTFAGEVLLMGWLLWRGRRLQATSVSTSPGVRQGPAGAGALPAPLLQVDGARSGSGRRPVPGPR